jgi:hypothetical protein
MVGTVPTQRTFLVQVTAQGKWLFLEGSFWINGLKIIINERNFSCDTTSDAEPETVIFCRSGTGTGTEMAAPTHLR